MTKHFYLLVALLIIALIVLSATLAAEVKNRCEETDGRWIHTRQAGFNNDKYKCIK